MLIGGSSTGWSVLSTEEVQYCASGLETIEYTGQ